MNEMWVWSDGRMTYRKKEPKLERHIVLLPVYPLLISHGQTWNRTPDFCDERPATNYLNHGAPVFLFFLFFFVVFFFFFFFFLWHNSSWWILNSSKTSSTLLGTAANVSNSSRPCSSDLPQLTQATSETSSAFYFNKSKLSARIQFLHSNDLSQPPHSAFFYHFNYV